tara:strand:+ start:554 stop:892 length:339 start_codon:yes stop_codon:yes gene_type:complete
MIWKQIADGKSFPFIIIWRNSSKPNYLLRAGIVKTEGKIGEKVTWRVHYLDSSKYEQDESDPSVRLINIGQTTDVNFVNNKYGSYYKDFKGKESRTKALNFAKKWMKKHPNG